MCELLLPVYDVSASKNLKKKYNAFTSAAVKSKFLAPLHRHEKRLKSCMCYKIVHYDTSVSLQHEPKASDVITLVKKTFFRTSIVRNFIYRGVKMRISARKACVKPHLRTRSDIKISSFRYN